MKKKILALLLALALLGNNSIVPSGTVAAAQAVEETQEESSETQEETIKPSQSGSGTGWSWESNVLKLEKGYKFDLSDVPSGYQIDNYGTIIAGTCAKVNNYGIITGETTITSNVYNYEGATITGGTFNQYSYNYEGATIAGGTFAQEAYNYGTITGGTFNYRVYNYENATITEGTFNCDVVNRGTISGGTFNQYVYNDNAGTISNGTFISNVDNWGTISGGTFETVADGGTITGGNITTLKELSHVNPQVMGYYASETEGKHYIWYMCDCHMEEMGYTLEEDCTPGDPATCTTAQTCTLCDRELVAAGHDWGDWENTGDAKQHTRTCKNDDSHTETADHIPGTEATVDAPQTCTECGYELAPALVHSHSWSTTYSKNTSHHWHECENSDCPISENSEKDGYGEHNYTVETMSADALKAGADCTQAATYYYSCICGAISTAEENTFTYGDPLDHSWSTTYSHNDSHHWHECENSDCPVKEDSSKEGYGEHSYTVKTISASTRKT